MENTTRKVSFLRSITTKVTLVLMLSIVAVISLVLNVVTTEGYEKISAESKKLASETGRQVLADVSFDLLRIENQVANLRDTIELLPAQSPLVVTTMDKMLADNKGRFLNARVIPVDTVGNNSVTQRGQTIDTYTENTNQRQLLANASTLKYNGCNWSELQIDVVTQTHFSSCSMPIKRNGMLWGVASVTMQMDDMSITLATIEDKLESSYAMLVDGKGTIIASSNDDKIPLINENGSAMLVSDYAIDNDGFDVIQTLLNQDIQTEQEKKTLEAGTLIEKDAYFRRNAVGFIYPITATGWKLLIVQSQDKTIAIAENLSKNIIKYVMFALLVMMAVIFFMLDFLALRPMEETAEKLMEANDLINNNKYHKLAKIEFPKERKDEMGIVTRSLKRLLQRIQDNEGKLAIVNQELEIKVEERTAELQNAMNDLKSSQVQLIRSEKMATLGQMVAGVAHEVNTPLTYVQNNVEIIGQLAEQYEEMVQMVSGLKAAMMDANTPEAVIEEKMAQLISVSEELEEDEIADEFKDLIKDSLFGVEQIADMVLNLRNFARLDESKVKKIDIKECVETSLKIAQNSIKRHKVRTHFQSIPEINCSPSQINQVIINLLNNASQAMGDRNDGQIDIRTTSDNEHVYIDIKDNGCGMSPEVVAKIFEPFYTTKGAGEGTGLGMAISQQIMEQHNGSIKVKSEEGKGTVFRLSFPMSNTVSDLAA